MPLKLRPPLAILGLALAATVAVLLAPRRSDEQEVLVDAVAAERGFATAVDGDWLAVGARLAPFRPGLPSTGTVAAVLVPRAGAVYLFHKEEDGSWERRGLLTAEEPSEGGQFGASVALRGPLLAVGEAGEEAVHVFRRDGLSWAPAVRLDGEPGSRFGAAVATDGEQVAVGAPGPGGDGGPAGAVHVYLGPAWTGHRAIQGPEPRPGDRFGRAVAIEGSTLAVGAPGRDLAAGRKDAGAVYVFAGPPWSAPQAVLTAPGGSAGDQLGSAVALDGGLLAAGAPAAGAANEGAAYVWSRGDDDWTSEPVSPQAGLPAGGQLGFALALAGDLLVAGAPLAGAGSVKAFDRDEAGRWVEAARGPEGVSRDDLFGFAVAAEPDGTVLVGAPLADPEGASSGRAVVLRCFPGEGCAVAAELDFGPPDGPQSQRVRP